MSNQTTKTLVTRGVLVVGLVVAAYFGYKKINFEMHHETTDNAQVEARFVPILPRVAGYIKTLYVEDYANVKKDSLLAEIDDSELALQLEEMEADLAQAETDIDNARANLNNTSVSVTSMWPKPVKIKPSTILNATRPYLKTVPLHKSNLTIVKPTWMWLPSS
jgi:membrane fusion protein (multidrug efflux system)